MADLPARIGPYRVISALGEGGGSAVFLAEDERGLRRAVKRVAGGPAARARLRAEFSLLCSLWIRGVPKAYRLETGPEGGWMAMEWIPGEHALAYVQRGERRIERAIGVLRGVCRILGELHGQGILHGDVKSSNVLVEPAGEAWLVDFGGARRMVDGAAKGGVFTRLYASPEQLAGGAIGVRSELYSLGVLAHRLVTGRRPGSGALDGAPAELAEVIRALLAADPADRPGSAGEVASRLAHL